MTSKKSEEFDYTPKNGDKAVLGVLEGPCADITDATRNGRYYSEDLWEKVFNSEIVKEMLENGGIFGESQHPTDRTEVDTEKIAIAMKERPVKRDGRLMGKFYILNTPCGRILKTLADFGYKIGISSRGSGDTYLDENGNESVDPDTYQFTCFDAVLVPAMKAARMKYTAINESLNANGKTLKKVLRESLDNSTEDERKVMVETLNELKIDINEDTTHKGVDILADSDSSLAADDDGAELVKSLQKTLKENRDLSNQLQDLLERLSVCYTKESKSKDIVAEANAKIDKLNESLSSNQSTIKTLNERIRIDEGLLKQFEESRSSMELKYKSIEESLKTKLSEVNTLRAQVSNLNEKLIESEKSREQDSKSLRENLREMTKDATIKRNEYTNKISKQQELIEKYKSIAKTAVDKYIKSQSVLLGVSPTEIKNRLSENYSFSDIDKVCESLRNYKLNVNSLPFENSLGKRPTKIRISESVKPTTPILPTRNPIDDEPDEQLLGLANFMGM